MLRDILLPAFDFYFIMKGVLLSVFVLLLSVYHLDAFLPSSRVYPRRNGGICDSKDVISAPKIFRKATDTDVEPVILTHNDVLWKLRPPPETSWFRKIALRLAANGIRLDSLLKGEEPPLVLSPKGGQGVLEAYYRPPGRRRRQKIARFGITTERGPTAPPIQETIKDVYGIDLDGRNAGIAAIIYMFVDPKYRNMGVGELALDVILAIHALNGCDFTILVTDDNGSGKLVQWYENNGFARAPKLQEMMGSPGGQYGETMISPTRQTLSPACKIQWW